MCKQIAVKAHQIPLYVTDKWHMVSIANTATGICGVCKYLLWTPYHVG